MNRRQFVSAMLGQALAGTTVCGLSGCGMFLHPERRGQPISNCIDWKVAALDGLGLLLFFVPGVVAFIVDFSTGAIYLPVCQVYPGYGMNRPVPTGMARKDAGLKQVVLPREQLQPQQLEKVVSVHVGQNVSLGDTQNRVSKLARVDQFDEQLARHRADRTFGSTIRSFFAQLKDV